MPAEYACGTSYDRLTVNVNVLPGTKNKVNRNNIANLRDSILQRRLLFLNQTQLLIAYYLMAFVLGGFLALLHTYWANNETQFVFATLQYPAQYAHSCGLVYLLAVTTLAFFRGRAFQSHRRLHYPLVASFVVNAIVMGAIIWVFARGVNARVFVVQDFYLVAVMFAGCLAMLLFDALAIRSRPTSVGTTHIALSIIVALLHVLASAAVVTATINLELKQLNNFIG